MPPSNVDHEITSERSEEDNESESSNQPNQDLQKEGLPATSRKTLFGLKKKGKKRSTPKPMLADFNRFDYEQKYPRDPFGQERAENARVWFTYLDEAESYDRDKIDRWKDTVDVLLVFAGLFSAVVTTFLSQTSQSLQQNFTQVSASLLFEIAQLHRAQLTGASIADVPKSTLTPNSQFTPSTNASVVNGLWFTSLAIGLCTALFAVLAKQWLSYYQSPVPGTARDKVMVRQFRFEGLEKWRVALIIDLLPILLHVALGLFLIGLVVFILPLDIQLVWIIIILSGFTYMLYLVSIILPIWYPQCPYATPLTIYIDFFIRLLQIIHFRIYFRLPSGHIRLKRLSMYRDRFISELSLRRFQHSFHLIGRTACTISNTATRVWTSLKANIPTSRRRQVPPFRNQREARIRRSIESAATTLQDKALDWLFSTSSNPAVSRIVARSVSKSPHFDIRRGLYYHRLSDELHNPRFADEWDEDSLRGLLDESEFFEDLYHRLHLTVLHGRYNYRNIKIVSFIQEGLSTSLREDIKESYPKLFSIISILQRDPVEVLLMGLRDNTFKLHQDLWLCLMQRARRDKELASHIISSGTFNVFSWHESQQPSAKADYTEAIHLANQLPEHPGVCSFRFHSSSSELNRSAFSYLFCYFVGERFPNDSSFESRYLLFIAVYQNLISNQPLIVDPTLRARTLKYLLAAFFYLVFNRHECIRDRVVTAALINRMQRDMLMHDSFHDNMSLDLQEAAIFVLEKFWEYQIRTTDDFTPFFIPQKEGLRFIYQRCSKRNSCALFVQQLFMPGNLSNLRMLLLEDRDHAKSNLGNCLRFLLWSSESSELCKHKVLYEEHIIPNVIHLFTTTILSDGSDPLFPVLRDPSILAQTWKLLVTYPSFLYDEGSILFDCPIMDRSRALLDLLPSRLEMESLRTVYDLMIGHIESSLSLPLIDPEDPWGPITMRRACISTYIFGRMAGLITDPKTFDFPSPIINRPAFKRAFKDVTNLQNELERQFMEEKSRRAHPVLFQFSRITRTLRNSLWKKRPEVEAITLV